jgi:uncharacterized protein
MSESREDPVAIVRAWYETKDPNLLDPGIHWEVLGTFPEGGSYVGRDVVIHEFFPRLMSHFSSLIAMPRKHYANGDEIVTIGRYEGAIGESSFVAEFAHIWRTAAGKLTCFKQITDTAVIQQIRNG